MLAERHHHRQFALAHDIVGLAHITHIANEQPDVLDAHSPGPMAIGDVVAGVMVEPGAEEAGTPLARSRAIPAEAHDIEQEVFKFRGVLRSDQYHVPCTALVGQKAAVGAPWLK
ncbi:hypothetical protein D3C72_1653940 [compost metagenome]